MTTDNNLTTDTTETTNNPLYAKAWDAAMEAIADFEASKKTDHDADWARGRIDGIRSLAPWIDVIAYSRDWEKWEEMTNKTINR